MDIVLGLLLLGLVAWAFSKFKRVAWWLYIPLTLLSIVLVMLGKNIADSAAYVDNHPWLNGNQVGWLHPHEVGVFGLILLLVVANAVYILMKAPTQVADTGDTATRR